LRISLVPSDIRAIQLNEHCGHKEREARRQTEGRYGQKNEKHDGMRRPCISVAVVMSKIRPSRDSVRRIKSTKMADLRQQGAHGIAALWPRSDGERSCNRLSKLSLRARPAACNPALYRPHGAL
jgi:hypothetical protein